MSLAHPESSLRVGVFVVLLPEGKPVTVIRCQTITLSIVNSKKGYAVQMELPAFTREPDDFLDRMVNHLALYMRVMREDDAKPSTADFLLFLAAQTLDEPAFMATATDAPEATDGQNGGTP